MSAAFDMTSQDQGFDEPFDPGAFGDFVRLYDRFVVVHHESEDRVVFQVDVP